MVAGLVGEGLSRLFVARGMASESICGQGERVWPFCADPKTEPANLGLANSMGLFLQKANIIRDYLEDYVDGRAFWPQSTWRKHTLTGDLGEFARPTAHGAGTRLRMKDASGEVAAKGVGVQALACLNELVADALELVPDSLDYLDRVKNNPAVFRFCAIPQVMAIATLDECFDNPKLFTGVVKIRKGLTARLICATVEGPDAVHWWFRHFARKLAAAVKSGQAVGSDRPLGERMIKACDRILSSTAARADEWDARKSKQAMVAGGIGALGVAVVAFSVLSSR
jgi:farnesyl-diphosphate farnesyltransferase